MSPHVDTDGDHPNYEDEVKRHRHIHSYNREPGERDEEPSCHGAGTTAYTQPTKPARVELTFYGRCAEQHNRRPV